MNIADQVKAVVVEQLGVEASLVVPSAHFLNDLGSDSLDSVELILALEDKFNITIPDLDAEKIQTVGQAIEYITTHKN